MHLSDTYYSGGNIKEQYEQEYGIRNANVRNSYYFNSCTTLFTYNPLYGIHQCIISKIMFYNNIAVCGFLFLLVEILY